MQRKPTRELLGLLSRNESLKTKGFSLTSTPSGGIVIDRSGHVHGILDFDGQSYTWVSPGSSEPVFRTGNAQSAILYTLVTLTSV